MSTVAPEPVACPAHWPPHYGTAPSPAAVATPEPFCEQAMNLGGAGEGYAWQAGCPRRYATAATATTTAAWPNRSPSLAAATASASSQFWMPPEDPWRWTRGAQPSSPTPRCPTASAHAPAPASHDPMHRYCYSYNNHCSPANDWMNAMTDNVFYGEAAPHLEPLVPAALDPLQRSCSAPQVEEKTLPCHPGDATKRSNSADKECMVTPGAPGVSPMAPATDRSSPPRAMRSHVHYRRESTYHMGPHGETGAEREDSARMRLAGGGADGDGGMAGYAATMERVHHTTLQGEGGVALRCAVSAEAVGAVGAAGAVAAVAAASRAASRSASCGSSVRSNSIVAGREAARGSTAGSGAGAGRLTTGISSNLSDYIWKPQEENAWELWYQKKKKEEQIRRRKEERRRKIMEQQEAAKRQEESVKKELEEENRKKWLQRKKRQQEEEKKRLEEQKQQAEKKAQEEAEKHEMRVRHHLELLKKANQRREEIRKEEAQRRELAQKQVEEARRLRQEQSARVLAEWNARAATKPRPLTGCIFNHDPQASVPKPALDFFNPEPWQF